MLPLEDTSTTVLAARRAMDEAVAISECAGFCSDTGLVGLKTQCALLIIFGLFDVATDIGFWSQSVVDGQIPAEIILNPQGKVVVIGAYCAVASGFLVPDHSHLSYQTNLLR